MTKHTEQEIKIIKEARQQERLDILDMIDKFVRVTILPSGDEVREIKVPANHLENLIKARGFAEESKLDGLV